MKIKVNTTMAGPFGSASPGDIIDVPEPIADGLITGGYAVRVDEAPKAEVPAVSVETTEAKSNLTAEKALGRQAKVSSEAKPAKSHDLDGASRKK
jgi:hypothetical protein